MAGRHKNGVFNEIWGAISAISKFATDILEGIKGLREPEALFQILRLVVAFHLMKDRESLVDGLVSIVPRK